METKNITQFYMEDHQRLDKLFQEYQGKRNHDLVAAKELFEKFRSGLERHILWEEGILFPLFESKSGMHGTGPTMVMRMEHEEIKTKLKEMAEKLAAGDANTQVEESGLLFILTQHNQKEENILYPTIDRTLEDSEVGEIFRKMKEVS